MIKLPKTFKIDKSKVIRRDITLKSGSVLSQEDRLGLPSMR